MSNLYIAVYDGAYGISFSIIKAESLEMAKELAGDYAQSVIDLSDYDNATMNMILWTEQPTGG